MLSRIENLTRHLTGESTAALPMPDDQRLAGLARFTARSATDYLPELRLIASEYESVRARAPAGDRRTLLMTALVTRAQVMAGREGAARVAELLFSTGADGARVVALALAATDLRRGLVELALDGIGTSRSAFEQYHALLLAQRLIPLLDGIAKEKLLAVLQAQVTVTITERDRSRYSLAQQLLKVLAREQPASTWKPKSIESVSYPVGAATVSCVRIRPTAAHVNFDDVVEQHGPWVATRGQHTITLPPEFEIAQHLVTNEVYLQFVNAGGYRSDEWWGETRVALHRFVTLDGRTRGPSNWPTATSYPEGMGQHPVTGISYLEAAAFVAWVNASHPVSGWEWSMPSEDVWEFAARTEAKLIYPWGDAFDPQRCNSSETQIGGTSPVTRFPEGVSRDGCYDMAGNTWEFVAAGDMDRHSCVLRGGSFRNNRYELRSYLRLFGVPRSHRPDDFGFRLARLAI
jgi:formylglycine-generating enzyme required for sulfatase activity